MKTLAVVVISIVALGLPVAAYAQGRGIARQPEKEETANDLLKKKAEEKAYKDSLSRVPSLEFDPWRGVRETPPVEKPSAPKKKPPIRPPAQ